MVSTAAARPEPSPAPRSVLANLLRRDGRKWTAGAYVLEMPVTIPEARAAGREIWGYPEFETEIPFKLQGNEFSFSVLDPESGDPLLSVRGREGPGFRMRAFDLVTFSDHDGRILKTVIDVDAVYRNCLCRGLEIKAGAGDHRLAANVRDLGLEKARPFALQSTDSFRSRLNPGTPVTSWETPPLPYPLPGEGPAKPLV